MNSIKSASGECRSTGLTFNIDNTNSGNDPGALAYIPVTGPGLPYPGGVRYEPPALGGRWQIQGTNLTTYIMASYCGSGAVNQTVTDSAIRAIPDNAYYSLTGYDSAGNRIAFTSGTRTPEGPISS